MPRPSKTFKRHKTNAAIAYKRGDRKEAYELWAKAAKGLKELRDNKSTRHQAKPEAEAEGEKSE